MNDLRTTRFEGLVNQIEYYLDVYSKRELSKVQREHLKELSGMVSCFGELGTAWAETANEALAGVL